MKCLINNVYFNESFDKTTMEVGTVDVQGN